MTKPKTEQLRKQRELVWKLRSEGKSFYEIAEACNTTYSNVRIIFLRMRARKIDPISNRDARHLVILQREKISALIDVLQDCISTMTFMAEDIGQRKTVKPLIKKAMGIITDGMTNKGPEHV